MREVLPRPASSARVRGFVASDRHRLEVNYYDYRRLLKRLIRRFGPVRKMKLGSTAPHTARRMPETVAE